MTNRYQTGKIYRLLCNDGIYYIGSTTQALNIRLNTHKTLSKTKTERIYEHINQIGWDKTQIELLEAYPCSSKDELNKKEKEYRSRAKSDQLCLNDSTDIINIDPANQTIYRNGKIYRIVGDDGHYYIGSTVANLSNCLSSHKQKSAISPTDSPYNHFIKIGWDKVKIELIEHYSCYSKDELDMKKGSIINDVLHHNKLCLNHNINTIIINTVINDNKYKHGKIYRLVCEDGHYYYGSTTTSLTKRFGCHKHAIQNIKHGGQYFYFTLVPLNTISIELVEEYNCTSKKELLQKENEYIIAHKNDPFCLNTYQSFQSDEDKKQYDKIYHEKNKDRAKEYIETHREDATQRTKEYRKKHRDEILKKEAEYREANRALLCEKQKEYVKQNIEKAKITRHNTYEKNKEHCKEYSKAYRKANQAKIQEKQKIWNHKKREENADKIEADRQNRREMRKEKTKERIEKEHAVHICECGGTYQLYRKKRHDMNKKHQSFIAANPHQTQKIEETAASF